MKQSAQICQIAAFLLVTCFALARGSERTGVVQGVVLDPDGKPVVDARVQANYTGAINGRLPITTTDRKGHFKFVDLGWGEWYFTASKEQDGYPDQSNRFYAGSASRPVIVTLDLEHPRQTVSVRLGRKAGLIVGTIADAQTGEPVEPCTELRWKSDASTSWSGHLLESNFRLLLPADTDIVVTVWAWGYEPWFYRSQEGGDSLRVEAGGQANLQIRMVPNKDKNREPTDEELKEMRKRASESGCSLPLPR